MRAFLDTSSLVKLYRTEPGSTELRAQLDYDAEIVVTSLTWVESTSTFGRIVRRKDLTQAQADEGLADLQRDWVNFQVVQLSEAILLQAALLLRKHHALALRSLDAIQLAAALTAGPLDAFFTHDDRLQKAAAAEKLPVR